MPDRPLDEFDAAADRPELESIDPGLHPVEVLTRSAGRHEHRQEVLEGMKRMIVFASRFHATLTNPLFIKKNNRIAAAIVTGCPACYPSANSDIVSYD